MKVLIVGMHRTGTTKLYVELCRAFRPLNPLKIFEFTDGWRIFCARHGAPPVHDVEGVVEDDLPILIRNSTFGWMFIENSRWFWDWVYHWKPEEPYCGRLWGDILNLLEKQDRPVIVKDVFLWPYLDYIAERWSNWLIIVPVRDRESLWRALEQWWTSRTPARRAKAAVAQLVRAVTGYTWRRCGLRIRRDYKTSRLAALRRLVEDVLLDLYRHPRVMLGEALYYRAVRGAEATRNMPRSLETLRRLLNHNYDTFRSLVDKVRDRENVLVVEYDNYMTQDLIEEVVAYAKRWPHK